MEDQDRDHISSRSHFSGRSDQELDEMLDELRAGKIGINQPGQNSSEHDSEDTPEENDNASGTGSAAPGKSASHHFPVIRYDILSDKITPIAGCSEERPKPRKVTPAS